MTSLSLMKSRETFLSADVKNLLEKSEKYDENYRTTKDFWLSSRLKINWENVEYTLNEIEGPPGTKCWFEKAIEELSPLLSHCDLACRGISLEDYATHIQPYVKWTYQEEVVSECFKLVHLKKDKADLLLALLMITSVAERALGNLLLTRSKQVPFLLRELLVTVELQDLLGKSKSQLLTLLFGSVFSLNLRNIAWHGFLSPREVKSSFITTIILTLVNIGQDLEVNLEPETCIPERMQTSFLEAGDLNDIFMKMPHIDKVSMEEIINHSLLVPDIMIPVWTKILDLLNKERYGLCLVLLLPMFECSMRCLFALINEETTRVLTAENSSFYTTFDEILQLHYETEKLGTSMSDLNMRTTPEDLLMTKSNSGFENQSNEKYIIKSESEEVCLSKEMKVNLVPFVIGEKLNESLHDLLNFIHGPRVRDRLSHGEVKLDQVPKDIVYHLVYINLLVLSLGQWQCEKEILDYFSSLFKVTSELALSLDIKLDSCSQHCMNIKSIHKILHSISMSELSSSTLSMIQSMKKYILEYKCQYHPSAILHKNLVSCIVKLEKWLEWDRISYCNFEYPDWETSFLISVPKYICYSSFTDLKYETYEFSRIRDFRSQVTGASYRVLYRNKLEIEFIFLCNRVISCMQSALDNIKENLSLKLSQYVNKSLRSRQRETYRRQLTAIPTIVLNFYMTCQLVFAFFLLLDDLLLAETFMTDVLKTLKKTLKLQENIVSQTSINVNRWDEALKNSTDNISNIKKEYGK